MYMVCRRTDRWPAWSISQLVKVWLKYGVQQPLTSYHSYPSIDFCSASLVYVLPLRQKFIICICTYVAGKADDQSRTICPIHLFVKYFSFLTGNILLDSLKKIHLDYRLKNSVDKK